MVKPGYSLPELPAPPKVSDLPERTDPNGVLVTQWVEANRQRHLAPNVGQAPAHTNRVSVRFENFKPRLYKGPIPTANPATPAGPLAIPDATALGFEPKSAPTLLPNEASERRPNKAPRIQTGVWSVEIWGDTFPHKEMLKQLLCRLDPKTNTWSRRLKSHADANRFAGVIKDLGLTPFVTDMSPSANERQVAKVTSWRLKKTRRR